jgi:hypothetical protein
MNFHLMVKPEMARQGDVLLIPIGRKPDADDLGKTIKEGKRLVLAHGEATGHAHAIYPERDVAEQIHANPNPATLYELRNVRKYAPTELEEGMYLEARERCYLRHEEHETIALAPGDYVVLRQVEFDGIEEMRRVAD